MEPLQPGFFECKDTGRRVYIPTNKGSVAEIQFYNQHTNEYQVCVEDTGEEVILHEKVIRWKAVDDLYRESYEKNKDVRTESGAESIHADDAIGWALLGTSFKDWEAIAKENEITDAFNHWVQRGRKEGMCRMNLGSRLRKMLRDHEKEPKKFPPPTINGIPAHILGEERKHYHSKNK